MGTQSGSLQLLRTYVTLITELQLFSNSLCWVSLRSESMSICRDFTACSVK